LRATPGRRQCCYSDELALPDELSLPTWPALVDWPAECVPLALPNE
jgi:hypothetical protein